MIVLIEAFLIWKHGWVYGFGENGVRIFAHAFFTPLNKLYLGLIFAVFLFIFVKVLISDVINFVEDSRIKKEQAKEELSRFKKNLNKEKVKKSFQLFE